MFQLRLPLWFCPVLCLALCVMPEVAQSEQPVMRASDGAPGEGLEPGAPLPVGPAFAQARPLPKPEVQADPDNEETGDASRLDEMDRRAPVEKGRQVAWQRATQAADQGDWPRMLEQIERMIGRADKPLAEDSMIRDPQDELNSSRLEAVRLLYRLPPEQRAARQRQTEGMAKELLAEALRSGAAAQLLHVAVHFAATAVGEEAADRLIALLVDRGEFALPLRWIQLLEEVKAGVTQSAVWSRRAELVRQMTESSAALPADRKAIREQFLPTVPQAVSEWWLTGGNARRLSISPAVTPLLMERWRCATTTSRVMRERLEARQDELALLGTGTIPASQPLTLGSRIVLRTVRGIEVIDAATGNPVWVAEQNGSLEALFDERVSGSADVAVTDPFAASVNDGQTSVIDPLSQFIYHNSAQNVLSSDGRRLFAMEDDPVFATGQTDVSAFSGESRNAAPGTELTNRLKALDVRNGRLLWQAGGPVTGEAFELPLAGWFFLGAPLPDEDELFVLAQKDSVIRLFCLLAESGTVRWSQSVSYLDEAINRNLIRRIQSAQISLSGGVLLCPTQAGWMVAVDRSTGQLLWSRRLHGGTGPTGRPSRRNPFFVERNVGMLEIAAEPLGSRWATSPPVVVGNRVFVTPFESADQDNSRRSSLLCLDLFHGRRLWQLGRDDGLYLAGVDGERLIVVGNKEVWAVSLSGNRLWRLTIPADAGHPSGRGLLMPGTLWLPMQNRSLLAVDLAKGAWSRRLALPEDAPPLGNLLIHNGLLLSVLPTAIVAFDLAETIERRLAAARRDAPEAIETALLEAQTALHRRDPERAIEILRPRLSEELKPSQRTAVRELLLDAVTARIEAADETDLQLLHRVEFTAQESSLELRRQQLLIALLGRLNRSKEAIELLLSHWPEATADAALLRSAINPRVSVHPEMWMAGELQRLWSQLSADELKEVERSAEALLKERLESIGSVAKERVLDALQRADQAVRLLSFLPEIHRFRSQLAALHEKHGRFADAAFWRGVQTRTGSAEDAAEALVWWLKAAPPGQSHLQRLATWDRLSREYPAVRLSDGTTVESLLPELKVQIEAARPASPMTWSGRLLSGSRSAPPVNGLFPQSLDSAIDEELTGRGNALRLEVIDSEGGSRLNFIREVDQSLYWSAPLRTGLPSGSSGGIELRRAGTLLLVLRDQMLNCYSVADRQILWTRSIELPEGYPHNRAQHGRSLQPGTDWVRQMSGTPVNPVPVVQPDYLCLRGHKSLTVLDARSGRPRWTMSLSERNRRIIPVGSTLAFVQPDGKIDFACDALDGAPVALTESGDSWRHVLTMSDRQVVSVRTDPPLTEAEGSEQDKASRRLFVECRTLAGGDVLWSQEFDAKNAFARLGPASLAVLRDRGQFQLVDLMTGEVKPFDRIPAALRLGTAAREYRLLSDADRIYLVQQTGQAEFHPDPSAPSISLNGHLLAFDRESGRLLWTRPVENGQLITAQFQHCPALLIRTGETDELSVSGGRLLVIDRLSGGELLSYPLADSSSLHSLKVDPFGTSLELHSASERIVIRAQQQPRAATDSPTAGQEPP